MEIIQNFLKALYPRDISVNCFWASKDCRNYEGLKWFYMVSLVAWLLGTFCVEQENDFEDLIGCYGNRSWKYADLIFVYDHNWRIEYTEMWKPVYVPVSER